MKIQHHPGPSTLLEYGSGSLLHASSSVVASHLEYCDFCRQELDFIETLGGAMLSLQRPEPLTNSIPALSLRGVEAQVIDYNSQDVDNQHGTVPTALAQFIGNSLNELLWQRLSRGVWVHKLSVTKKNDNNLRLIKLDGGRPLPRPGSGTIELTMVLRGFFHNNMGAFGPGNVIDYDVAGNYRSISDEFEGCIALSAIEKPLRKTSIFTRLFQPFSKS